MRTCALIVLYLFLFACKPSGDKPDMSIFDKPITPAAFAAQNNACRQLPNNVDRSVTTQTDTVAVRIQTLAANV